MIFNVDSALPLDPKDIIELQKKFNFKLYVASHQGDGYKLEINSLEELVEFSNSVPARDVSGSSIILSGTDILIYNSYIE